MSSAGQALSDLGTAVTDLFGAGGEAASANSFLTAEQIANQNAEITKNSGLITQTQLSRNLYQTLGTETADTTGAGFTIGGSGLDLLRSSTQQGALAKASAEQSTLISENSYAEQAGLFAGMAGAAKAAGTSETIGGALTAVGAAGNLISAVAPGAVSGAVAGVGSAVGSALGIDLGTTVAADAGMAGVADAGAAIGGTVAGAATGGSILGGIGDALLGLVVGWIICTELMRQGRLPKRWWIAGARIFARYPVAVKEGYYVWAVPSVKHLRAHPNSLYSRFLATIFNWRAENIAASAGVPGARKLLRGAVVTIILWPICYAIGAVRIALRCTTDWKQVYG